MTFDPAPALNSHSDAAGGSVWEGGGSGGCLEPWELQSGGNPSPVWET